MALAILNADTRHAQILDSLGQYILVVSQDGRLEYLNKALAALIEADERRCLGKPLSEVVSLSCEDSGLALTDLLPRRMASGETLPLTLQRGDDLPAIQLTAQVNSLPGMHSRHAYVLIMWRPAARASTGGGERSADALTGLMARREFEQRLDNLVNDAAVSSRTHALVYIDIDQFKLINDTSGHSAGDNLIKAVADCLTAELFVGDILCRMGGDEFGVLLSNVDLFEARSVANRLVKAVKRMSFLWGGISHQISISAGVVWIDEEANDREAVMSRADVAVFSAKEEGRGRVHVYDKRDGKLTRLHDEMDWVHRIHEALKYDHFSLVTERILPLWDSPEALPEFNEILVRMSGGGGLLSPGQFMPAAERFGLMSQIDGWVVKHFFAHLQDNPSLLSGNNMYSINLSGQSLCEPAFLEFVSRQLQRSRIDPAMICFEITETVAITNFGIVTRCIERIREIGGRFALDDFGTGMSSFGYLQKLPVDIVKIDGLFVHDMDRNPVHAAMVRSINEISHVLGKKTIAEFVERPEIMDMLRDCGVDYAQGHLHGLPQALSSPA